MVIWVADVHTTYQAGLDVDQLADEGYSALIVKATESAPGYPSAWAAPGRFEQWIGAARNAGMIPGTYHWLTGAPAHNQVDHFLGRLNSVGGVGGMICAVDVEDNAHPPDWSTLRDFVNEFHDRTQHPIMIYSSNWWWTDRDWDASGLTPYLWDSRYVTGSGSGSSLYSHVPESWWTPRYGGWPRSTMLQFTSSADAGGLTEKVDVSAFDGTIDDLRALTGEGGLMSEADILKMLSDITAATGVPGMGGVRDYVPGILTDNMIPTRLAVEALAARSTSGVCLYCVSTAPTEDERNEIWTTNGVCRWHVPDATSLDAIRNMGSSGLLNLAAGGAVQDLPCHIGQPAGQPVSVSGSDLAAVLAPGLIAALGDAVSAPLAQLAATLSEAISAISERQNKVAAALAAAGDDLAAADDEQPSQP